MKRTWLTIAFVCFATGASADPSPGVRWLMNDPVTVFDWGMQKLDRATMKTGELINQSLSHGYFSLSKNLGILSVIGYGASYDFESNEIEILFHVQSRNETRTPENCPDVLKGLRVGFFLHNVTYGYYLNSTEQEMRWVAAELMRRLFSHEGFLLKPRPNDIGEELARITKFRVVYSRIIDQSLLALACEAPLTSNTVSIQHDE